VKLAYIGDGNNVLPFLDGCRSARRRARAHRDGPQATSRTGKLLRRRVAMRPPRRARLELFRSPEEAVSGAQAVYTDVWASMGQEAETEMRAAIFAPYQVNAALMSHAAPDAVFLHCLPRIAARKSPTK